MDDDILWTCWHLSIILFTEMQLKLGKTDQYANIEFETRELAIELEIDSLREHISEVETKLRESQSQRAILESVISERLESERAAVSQSDNLLRSLRKSTARVSDLANEVLAERLLKVNFEQKVHVLETQLIEVESFIGGENGARVLDLESELAEARLALAEAESDKDDLEQRIAILTKQGRDSSSVILRSALVDRNGRDPGDSGIKNLTQRSLAIQGGVNPPRDENSLALKF